MIEIRDPVTGLLSYSYVAGTYFYGEFAVTATAYDLADEFPWARYTVNQSADTLTFVLTSAEALMDDGSSVLLEVAHFYDKAGSRSPYQHRWTTLDEDGRLDFVLEITERVGPPARGNVETDYRALNYDTATGRLDYSHIIYYIDGREESIDYDTTTGLKDYVLINYRNGQTVAEDYNATTGLIDYRNITNPDGHSLSQDFDAAGRLDYELERWADGRMVVTDYDLLDQHAWSVYRIAYSAAGAIESVTVL